ncbi:valine--tRNA ligase [Buchnera aphidicola]|uniref:valine--tRNA ligase n=1 Tax=Buchnera aphidicola TaxID=9 RepID=UPI0031B866D8
MKKNFIPQDIEKHLYNFWETNLLFQPTNNLSKNNFCIMIPPPNITGNLHMGHAFQQTIMDILIRYHRMMGDNTFWQVGTDHAGIATQVIVEKKLLLEEKKNRQEYTRKKFINKIWEWKKLSSSEIVYQMRRLGNSVDWSRERFTLDMGISQAVIQAFILLYKDNLIYRKKRLVNWDPKMQTVVSDLEVNNKLVNGFIWYIKYPLLEDCSAFYKDKYLVVATTRPETLFGDVAIAINPNDKRYLKLLGKHVLIPLINRPIPIIFDEYVKINQDTGCVKITPGHDFNDYKVSIKHNLPIINIFTLDGKIIDFPKCFNISGKIYDYQSYVIPTQFKNLDRFIARKYIIDELSILNLLDQVISRKIMVPHGDRSGSVIEPMLTNQWYLRTTQLAKVATQAVRNGDIVFIPKQYKNLYFSWMENIQDWCISRQLWWGHRIPVWYDLDNNIYVGKNEMEVRQKYNINSDKIITQDEDVLDTWFSSSLWSFASLGWPNNTDFLKRFHPTSVLVSGFDIIFFWIARMIMLTMYLIKDDKGNPQIPFKTIYITGLIRDENGKKMSKSHGNVIDPIDMIDGISLEQLINKRTIYMIKSHNLQDIVLKTKKLFPKGIQATGADALRFTFSSLASTAREIVWDMNRLKGYRNFCNKLWNASRFILLNVSNKELIQYKHFKFLTLADQWIILEFNDVVKKYRNALDTYRFDQASNILYDFVWYKFCDWYLESVKKFIHSSDRLDLTGTKYTLVQVLEALLCLAHPIIPFITEEIWQRIRILTNISDKSIMLRKFPEYNINLIDNSVIFNMNWIQSVVVSIRNIRSSIKSLANKLLPVFFKHVDSKIIDIIKIHENYLKMLAQLKSITIVSDNAKLPLSITKLLDGAELSVPISGIVDKDFEITRLYKEIHIIQSNLINIKNKLSDKKYVKFAPINIIKKDKLTLLNLENMQYKLIKQIQLILEL